MTKHYVKILRPVHNETYAIYLDKGAKQCLNEATPPMIKALREHFLEDIANLEITFEGVHFLFKFEGRGKDPDDKLYSL